MFIYRFFAYRSFNLNNQLERSNDIIDSITWSELINLNNSLHRISDELMDYDYNLDEKELYFTLIGKESSRLNEIGMNFGNCLAQIILFMKNTSGRYRYSLMT